MNPTRPSLENSSQLRQTLDRFEQAWQTGSPPAIEDFLPAPQSLDAPARRQLLEELVKLDLEYRWRRGPDGRLKENDRFRLEVYVARFPQLGPVNRLPVGLIGEEYLVRQAWGDRPAQAEYLARFGSRPDLQQALSRIDRELASESADGPGVPAPNAAVFTRRPPTVLGLPSGVLLAG